MTQKEFFSDLVWLGKIIRFSHSTDTSGWRLETKYNDKNDQLTAEDYNIDAVNYRKPSAAYGTFRCRNVKNDGDIAVLKIIMQIPYGGSEYGLLAERARQATDILPNNACHEIEPLQILTKNKSKVTPIIREFELLTQDDEGLVPGGFLYYILMDHAPGIQLKDDVFWSFEYGERHRIRNAFRVAWEECLQTGVYAAHSSPSHLFWNAESSRIVIAGFSFSRPAEPDDKWTDIEWVFWGLADCPTTYFYDQEALDRSDKSDWTL